MLKPTTLLVVLLTILSANTHAQTNISGQIRQNTTWTKSGSPYILSGLVEVAPSVTLNVEPGVTIETDEGMSVYGILNAIGTKSDSIHIKHIGTRPHIYIHTYTMQGNKPGVVNFNHCYFDKMNVRTEDNGRINISNSYFNWCSVTAAGSKYVISLTNSTILEGAVISDISDTCIVENTTIINGYIRVVTSQYSKIVGNTISGHEQGILYRNNFDGALQDNIISDMKLFGVNIELQYLNGKAPVSGNVIHNCETGIRMQRVNGYIERNILYGNKTAIETKNYGTSMILNIEQNSIYDNETGIKYSTKSDVIIKDNCIYDNSEYNFYNNTTENYIIGENWWGTTDSTQIEKGMFDYEDDFKKGKVSFMPVLQTADSNCKRINTPPNTVYNISIDNSISCYPNPFRNTILFKTEGVNTIKEVRIYNLVGELVVNERYNNNKQVSINTTDLAPGIYIHHTTLDNNTKLTGKIIRQ